MIDRYPATSTYMYMYMSMHKTEVSSMSCGKVCLLDLQLVHLSVYKLGTFATSYLGLEQHSRYV